jgi:hypothetical protein
VVGQWVRRVYDARNYVDGARHLVVAETPTSVKVRCGRELARTTSAKAANHLVPSPVGMIRSDQRTCGGCQLA